MEATNKRTIRNAWRVTIAFKLTRQAPALAQNQLQKGTSHDMKPQHISELIAELIATGKLPPEEKRARPARKPVRKVRKARQLKLNLK